MNVVQIFAGTAKKKTDHYTDPKSMKISKTVIIFIIYFIYLFYFITLTGISFIESAEMRVYLFSHFFNQMMSYLKPCLMSKIRD